jgi:iron complex transport system substrate-binding protein
MFLGRFMRAFNRFLAILAALVVMLPAAVLAQTWSFTDDSGNTATADHIPTRIVAHAWAAAGLIAYGIRPIAIYADGPVAEDPALKGLDLTGIEIVGEVWGEMNIEKIAALKPDLIVSEWWPLEKAYSGFEANTDKRNEPVLQLAPIVGITQGNSVVKMIEDYGRLAQTLGVDTSAPELLAKKSDFETSLADFKAAVAAKPALTVLAVWAGTDALYVASPNGSAELSDFVSWGLDVVTPEVADDRGYWETLSWEQVDKYQPDLIIVDDRQATTRATAEAQPTWTLLKAAAAKQVADWPAFWIRSYEAYARELRDLTAAINGADEHLAD